ncbi:MAG TPA: Mur ligase domain-containing protein, partial [Candidatus Paceibacterota bacterium]|nr:Mur ligase domain-containing protein [Candidatus Paceibacterota bacterium]
MTNTSRTIFFSGIGGIGMSALAQLLHDQGDTVLGSDRSESPVTELLAEKGITVIIGQDGDNIGEDIDVFVYSAAVLDDNPERMRARELSIPEFSYFEMLGQVSETHRTVAVAGTHGKTTTTGMLARILSDAGAEPTAVVGSIVRDFGSNYLPGSSDLFVAEACEYRRHFLTLTPEVLVITNLEFDHSDYFTDLKDVQQAFRSFIEKVPAHGVIVTDTEHPNIAPLLVGVKAKIVNYTSEPAYSLQLPGEFNTMNARAAAAAAKAVLPT